MIVAGATETRRTFPCGKKSSFWVVFPRSPQVKDLLIMGQKPNRTPSEHPIQSPLK